MPSELGGDRHSRAKSPELIHDPAERAEREARNALQQFDQAIEIIDDWLKQPERQFRLRLSMLLGLHRAALEGISSFAGNFRPAGVEIEGSKHEPIGAHLVPGLLEEMCDYVNDNWGKCSAIHLAAYVMWRLNWIHPFDDGNGRTSRMISYAVFCIHSGFHLPGKYTIPQQIAENKRPYYEALEKADEAFADGRIDVAELERLISDMLASQLVEVYQSATGDQDTSLELPVKLH